MIESRKTGILFYVVYFMVVAAASAAVFYQILSYGEETRVPNFVGKSLNDAKELASSKNLHIKVDGSDYNPEIPVGYVSHQQIVAGSEVKEEQIVGVTLSKGPLEALIPDFVGKTLENARFLAVEQGLDVRKISYTHHGKVPKGTIITQNPLPGERGASIISLLVSQGPKKRFGIIPFLTGDSVENAKEMAGEAGFRLSYKGRGNTVIDQSPRAGKRVLKGEKIVLVLGNPKPSRDFPWEGNEPQPSGL